MAEIPQVKLAHNLCDAHLNVNNAGDVMESPETLWNRRRHYGITRITFLQTGEKIV